MFTIALLLAATPPADRSYVMADTAVSTEAVALCSSAVFDKLGRADNNPADYGRKVDFRFCNLGGCVDSPTMTLEIHDGGDKRTLLLYGFKTWRGATKRVWKDLAKQCFPEIREAPVIKPD